MVELAKASPAINLIASLRGGINKQMHYNELHESALCTIVLLIQ